MHSQGSQQPDRVFWTSLGGAASEGSSYQIGVLGGFGGRIILNMGWNSVPKSNALVSPSVELASCRRASLLASSS